MVIEAEIIGSLRAPYFFGVDMEHIHNRGNPEKAIGKPQYLRSNVNWLYVAGYYDGPLNGRILLRHPDGHTQSLWAQIFEECNEIDADDNPVCGFYRRYLLYRLNPGSNAEEERRHALFEKYVGTHWSYDVNGQRQHSGLKPLSEHHKYYDQAKHWPAWKPEGEVIGWFEI